MNKEDTNETFVSEICDILQYTTPMSDNESPRSSLYWDSAYEIVLSLINAYPTIDVEQVGIDQLYQLIIALPNFADDPALVNDGILIEILREWYEEANL